MYVRHSTLILSLPSPLICDCIWLSLVHSSVLCFRRPLNAGFVSGRSIFSLILWFCTPTNPSLPTLLCFHPDQPLVITSYICFIPRPSSFHSSNLCLYPIIHSSSHLLYICIRTILSSPFPVGVSTLAISSSLTIPFVCYRGIISMFTFSNMFLYPQRHLFVLSLLPCLFPDHHLLDISVLFVSRSSSLYL